VYKKVINCPSCEVKSDVIVRQTNYDTEEIEVLYCPICSAELIDIIMDDWDEEDDS
jgi:uncharacterized protein CbrC (UPF0167 family)